MTQENIFDFDTENLDTQEKDVLGYKPLETDAYKAKITEAYILKPKDPAVSKAEAIVVTFDIDDGEGNTVQRTKNFYYRNKEGSIADKKNPKVAGFGFIQANALCLAATGKELKAQQAPNKLIEIYNAEAKAKAPTEVPVLIDLVGKEVVVIVEKQLKNKQKKVNGIYKHTAETVERDEIVKVLYKDGRTVTELGQQAKEATFKNDWVAKNKGKTVNKVKQAEVQSESAGMSLDTATGTSSEEGGLF